MRRVALGGAILALLVLAPVASADYPSAQLFVGQQLNRTTSSLSPPRYPYRTTSSGSWYTGNASTWIPGFTPAMLWLKYEETGDPAWRANAERWQGPIDSQKTRTNTHDLGFMLFLPYGHGHRLTGNGAWRSSLLTAARSLATRYRSSVGAYKASYPTGTSSDFKVVIDQLMNVELFMWSSKNGGPASHRGVAISHALKAAADHVRADGSTYHVVNYNPGTGAVRWRGTKQGYSDSSTWSRGQAWAIYGFTMMYRETGDTRFLDAARKTADWYIAHVPADKVPYWDFDDPAIPNAPRDTSAAAVVASGLLELGHREPDATRAQGYRDFATQTLDSLSSPAYLAQGTPKWSVLLHGTHNKPSGTGIDEGLIWGDYYFQEALMRAQGQRL